MIIQTVIQNAIRRARAKRMREHDLKYRPSKSSSINQKQDDDLGNRPHELLPWFFAFLIICAIVVAIVSVY